MFRYFCFLGVILGVRSASAPPFIKPCKVGDTPCIVASAQAALPFVAVGIPELGIKSLDPMYLKHVNGDKGDLKFRFKDTYVTGMKDCFVDGIKQDLIKNKQSVIIRCSVVLKGNYTLNGKILILPVQGDDKFTITIKDIVIKTWADLAEITGEDNKTHWHISNYRHNFHIQTSTVFKFENLFNGNKILAGPVEEFMNNNWSDVMKELASPVVQAIVSNVVDAVEALYKAVPAEELFLE